VTSNAGTEESVTVALDCGLKDQPQSVCELIADQLHVPAHRLAEVVERWSADDFREHCAKLSPEELRPPSMRRRF
jgi:hypothetical protein